MLAQVQFLVSALGQSRRLLVARETNNEELIITPTRNYGMFDGSEDAGIFGGELTDYGNNQYTVHTCDDSAVMNLINYKKQTGGAGSVRRIVTNAIKTREEFFPLTFYACGSLRSTMFDPLRDWGAEIHLGQFDPSLFCFCYAVYVSSKQKKFHGFSEKFFDVVSYEFTRFQLHIVSSCILLPGYPGKRGIRYTLHEHPENLNDLTDDQLRAMKINSYDEQEVLETLLENIGV